MRIRLKKGKQKELILLAKGKGTWKELASRVRLNAHYLSTELKNEERLLSKKAYELLSLLTKKDYSKFVLERKDENWGRSKGGKHSQGSTKKIPKIEYNEQLAEFVGAVLGDGHVCYYKKGKKVGTYMIQIGGDIKKEKEYHELYLKNLCKSIFNMEAKIRIAPNERFLYLHSKEIVNLFEKMGIKRGKKKINQSTIPRWIFQKKALLKACVRGLIDTDGCIHRMSRKDPQLIRINFTNLNKSLLIDTRKACIKLGFHPSKIIKGRVFYISRQSEIRKFLNEIGFSNKKHIQRAQSFIAL